MSVAGQELADSGGAGDLLFDSGSTGVRELGARGSRAVLDPGPADGTSPGARAVLAAVPGWWEQRARAAGLDGRWLDVEQAIAARPPITAATEPVAVGLSGEQLGAAYVAALPAPVRARHGRHYTPTDLAAQLWTMARRGLGDLPLRGLVRDPACGAGALLLPAVRAHLAATRGVDPSLVLARLPSVIEGNDLDPAAVWLANVVLAAEALPLLVAVPASRRRPLPVLATVGDGLARPARSAAVVLMNPPYGRVRLDPAERQRFARYLYGHANLFGLFIAAGLEGLDDRGVLAALVPTSVTAGRYSCALRAALCAAAPLREITFVAERDGVFSGVLQETCLAVFGRDGADSTRVSTINGHATRVATVVAPRTDRPWLLPRRPDDAAAAAAAAAMPHTLASAGWRVSTGPLVWNRRRADLFDRPGPDRHPIVWAADVDGGRLHRDPARDTTRYLAVRTDRDRTTMLLDEPAILVQRTTAPEQTRRVVAVALGPGELATWGGSGRRREPRERRPPQPSGAAPHSGHPRPRARHPDDRPRRALPHRVGRRQRLRAGVAPAPGRRDAAGVERARRDGPPARRRPGLRDRRAVRRLTA